MIDIKPASATGSSKLRGSIKVEGEVKYNARKDGGPRRLEPVALHGERRKIHIGIDEQTLEIRAVEITTSNVGDAPMLPDLLDQVLPGQEIASVTAGAPSTPASAMRPSPRAAAPRSFRPAERQAPGGEQRRDRPQQGPACIQTLRPSHLATMERLSPPEPHRGISR